MHIYVLYLVLLSVIYAQNKHNKPPYPTLRFLLLPKAAAEER